jgi:hypothetical protein
MLVFLTSDQDCNSGMQKRIHFRTDMEHNICRPVNNSDVSLGYQFCKNITFILYINTEAHISYAKYLIGVLCVGILVLMGINGSY